MHKWHVATQFQRKQWRDSKSCFSSRACLYFGQLVDKMPTLRLHFCKQFSTSPLCENIDFRNVLVIDYLLLTLYSYTIFDFRIIPRQHLSLVSKPFGIGFALSVANENLISQTSCCCNVLLPKKLSRFYV